MRTVFEALEELARRVAILELVPYHSANFGDYRAIIELPSARQALQFARTQLAARATKDRATVIVTRQVEAWGLKEARNVILYDRSLARGASLGSGSPGHDAILKRILG